MSTFSDNQQRQWTLQLDAPMIEAVREVYPQINLADTEGKTIQLLADDPCLLANTLWLLCKQEALTRGVSDVDFGRAIIGDVFDDAAEALCQAILFFSPKLKRSLLEAVIKKQREVETQGTAAAMRKINDPALAKRIVDSIEADMDAKIEQALTRLGSAIPSPDSAASTPTD